MDKHEFKLDQKVIYKGNVFLVDKFLFSDVIKIRPLDIMDSPIINGKFCFYVTVDPSEICPLTEMSEELYL